MDRAIANFWRKADAAAEKERTAPLTSAERQARRRDRYTKMREALEAIRLATSLKEAKALADATLTWNGHATGEAIEKARKR